MKYDDFSPPSNVSDAAPQAEEPTIGSEISRGFSSGLRSAGANLNQLAGLGGEAVGANDFAKGRYADAKSLRAQAEEMAPVTNSWSQVNDLRSGAHFVAGQLGAMAPVAGAAVAGGLATGNPFTAGTIAMGLPAAGDIAARQQEDAQASQESPGARLTKSLAGGLVTGGVQSIGPGMFAGKVLGKGVAAASPGIGGIIAKNMAEGVGVNAAGGAAGEAISQYATNQDKALDYAPIKDAAITGGVVGSVFGAGGATAEALHSGGGSVRTSINDRLAAAKTAAADATQSAADTTAGKKFTSVAEDVSSLFQKGTKAASDAVDRVMQGRHEGDDATLAAATPEQAADILKGSDAEQTKQSAGWGEQMMNSAGVSPELYQKVSDAMGNISEPAGRATMAGLKKVWDAGQDAVTKASALRESFKRRDVDVEAREITTPRIGDGDFTDVTPIMKSEDYSGANKAIADKLGPLLANSQPELVNKPGAMADVADSLRQAVAQMPDKQLSSNAIFRLIDSLGSDTAATLEGAYKVVGDKDPVKAESFYTRLNEIADQQSRSSNLRNLVGDSLTEKSQRLIRSSDLGELTQALISHARGDMNNPNAGPQEQASQARQLKSMMAEHFGDKADAVTKAIQKEAGIRTKEEARVEPGSETDSQQGARGEDGGIVTSDKYGAYDESGGRLDAQNMETIEKGRGPNNDPVMDPALFASRGEPGQNYAAQYIKDMQAKYPDHNVRFVKDEGSQTHGHVIAEKAADPEKLSNADVDSMKLDKKYPNSSDKIVVDGQNLDTKRIAKVMDRRLEYTIGDEQSRAHRMSRMFHEGIARLTEQLGSFEVPDKAVIGKIGGKDFTFGDSKKLRRDTAADTATDANAQQYAELRKQYAQATWSPEKLAQSGLKRVELSDKEMAALKKKAAEYGSLAEFEKNRELTSGDSTGSGARFNKDGDLTKEGATALQEQDGRTATGKGDQIRQTTSALGEGEAIFNKSNMDGSAQSVSDRPPSISEGKNSVNDLVMAAREWRTADTAAARAIGERATVLLKNVQRMTEADQRTFMSVAGGSAADASSVVNALAQKYKSGIVAPGVKGESIKAVAGTKQEANPVKFKDGNAEPTADAPKSIATEPAKQGSTGLLEKAIDKRQEYLSNPPENYSTEVAKGHLDWAAKQKERVDAEYEKAKTGDDVERQGQLSDLRGSLGRLITKAKSVLEGDASLKDFEGSTPSPKEVAAKKAALLEAASSSDPKLLKELSTTDNAAGLQRTVAELASRVDSGVERVSRAFSEDHLRVLTFAENFMRSFQGSGLEWESTPVIRDIRSKLLSEIIRDVKGARETLSALDNASDQFASFLSAKDVHRETYKLLNTEGGAPLSEFMRAIQKSDNMPGAFKLIAQAVAKVAGDVNVLKDTNLSELEGSYSTTEHKISIAGKTAKNATSTVLHEGVHAATVRAVENNPGLHKALYDLLGHVVDHDPKLKTAYGTHTTLEFLAEGFSNEGFQQKLKDIPPNSSVTKYLGETVANAWESLIGLVRKALGFKPGEANALTQLMDLGTRAMKENSTLTEFKGGSALLLRPLAPEALRTAALDKIRALDTHHDTDSSNLTEAKNGLVPHAEVVYLELTARLMEQMKKANDEPLTKEQILGAYAQADSLTSQDLVPKRSGIERAIDAANKRMGELVQDPQTAYALLTKKYSLESTSRAEGDLDKHGSPKPEKMVQQLGKGLADTRSIMRVLGFRSAPEGFTDVAAKLLTHPDRDMASFVAQSAKALSHILAGGDYLPAIKEALQKDAWFGERAKVVAKLVQDGMKRPDAMVESYRVITERALSGELAARAESEKSALGSIMQMVKDFVSKFKAMTHTEEFADVVRNQLNDLVAKANSPAALKENFKRVTFQEAVDGDKQSAAVLAHMSKDPNIALTGSIVLAHNGSIYRNAANMLHDLDLLVKGSTADAVAHLKSAFPGSVQVYDFAVTGNKIDTFIAPPKGATVENIIRAGGGEGKGKVLGFSIMKDGQEIGRTWNDANGEHKSGQTGTLVDFFSGGDPKAVSKIPFTIDGENHSIAAVAPGGIFDAKLGMRRAKDTDDYVGYTPNAGRKFSAEGTEPGTTRTDTPENRIKIADHITKVLADSVKLKFADLTHAGEFERMRLHDVIRLSVHALDPLSTAYHESIHAFFAQLKDAKATDISDVLAKAASSEHVMAQLTERFKNEPEVLKQLKDPEERAAYMYQMWAADPSFKVSIASKTVFGKIADFIRSTLGIWSNDERALHIMQYFNEGKYAQDMKNPSAVRDAVMSPGRNQALEAAHSFVKPLANFADAIVGSGSSRLRDTGVKALGELADLIKREHTTEGGDQGYIAAARLAMTKRMGDMGNALSGYSPEHLQSAMEQLQSGKKAAEPEARLAARTIQKTLAETKAYMEKSGLEMGDLGPDYFPRVWDNHYISKNLPAFRDMLEPYVRRGEFKGSVDQFIQRLSSREGNEFGIEKTQPGMQFSKARLLSFIKPEDASQFLKKDLFGTMSSYVGQATRLAEWNRRLGGGKLEDLMSRAKDEGATPDQLKTADNYLKGINGTLGDSRDTGIGQILNNPNVRRWMGNMIVYQNVRLLPMAAFSMLIDPNGVMVRGGTVKDAWSTFKRGMSELPQTFGKDAKPDEATRLAELTGVIDSAMLTHTMSDLYTQGMVGGVAKTVNNMFFKYNMVEGLNRSFRVGASEAAMNFMARHADGTNSTHSERFMNELGIQKGDIIPTKDGRIALTTADGLKPEQVERVHAAVNQWVDGAILRPDAADKPIWMNDPRFALVSHLKQFVYSFQKTILDRTMHEMKHGNYTPAMALASYVPVMMAADFLKGALVSGGGQPEWQKGWDIADYVGYGMQRAGLAGVGQFGLDIAKDIHRGGIGIGALTGPTIEQFGDAVQLMGGHKQFGPMVLNAMPANALYAHAFGGGNVPDPMFAE